METLIDKQEITALCQEVFDQADLTKTEIARVMGVSDVAVHHMLNPENKAMGNLMVRFLRTFGGVAVEGPGYYVEGDGTISVDEATDEFGLTSAEVTALIEDGKVQTTDEGRVAYASLYTHMLTAENATEGA